MSYVKTTEYIPSNFYKTMGWLVNLIVEILTYAKRQIYLFYHKTVKRPWNSYVLAMNKQRIRNYNEDVPRQFNREEDLRQFHLSAFLISEGTDDPFISAGFLSPERKLKFCKKKLRTLKRKLADYYRYTNGRIKPEDIYELEILKKEMKTLNVKRK